MAPPSGRSADLDFSLDDLDVQSLRSSRSPWVMRSLMGAGALAFALVIYLGAGDAGSEETAQAGPASPSGPSVARAPQVEEEVEPSAWEKEQAMLKEADRLDAAAQARAAAFGASLAGEGKQEKASSSPAKRTWRPKAKKSTAAKSTGHSEYDPMNGTL